MDRNDLTEWPSRDVARLLSIGDSDRRYYLDMLEALPVAVAIVVSDNGTQYIKASNRAFNLISRGKRVLDQVLPSPHLRTGIDELLNGSCASQTSRYLDDKGRRFRAWLTPQPNWAGNDGPPEVVLLLEDLVRATILLVEAVGHRLVEAEGQSRGEYLRSVHYDVIEASTARMALDTQTIHSGPIHLLVTDVMLPDLSGEELANLLRVKDPAMGLLYMMFVGGPDAPGGQPALPREFTHGTLLESVQRVSYPR
jgi:CheY-like chemotaxis protein